MSRKNFGIISLVLIFIANFLDVILRPTDGQPGMEQIEFYSKFIPWVVLPFIIVWLWCATMRAKEIGLKAASIWRLLIPFYNLYFVFVLLLAGKGYYNSDGHTEA